MLSSDYSIDRDGNFDGIYVKGFRSLNINISREFIHRLTDRGVDCLDYTLKVITEAWYNSIPTDQAWNLTDALSDIDGGVL